MGRKGLRNRRWRNHVPRRRSRPELAAAQTAREAQAPPGPQFRSFLLFSGTRSCWWVDIMPWGVCIPSRKRKCDSGLQAIPMKTSTGAKCLRPNGELRRAGGMQCKLG